jgi:glycosyltransferase involved in cell wall biosynthesis
MGVIQVSAIIAVHNGERVLGRCLEALHKALPPPDEVIVVIDGCSDDSEKIARQQANGVVVLPPPAQGPAIARNRGARRAHGEILLFVDADVVVGPQTVARVLSHFAREPGLTAIFGSYDDGPEAPNFLSQFKNLYHHYVHQTASEDARTFWAGCGAIRRRTFLAVGGFDGHYRKPSIEDIELGCRLKKSGHAIRLDKSLMVKHLKRWGFVSLLKSDIRERAGPWTQLLLRERCWFDDLNLKKRCRFSVAALYLTLAALPVCLWHPVVLTAVPALLLVVLIGNIEVYRFFFRRKGMAFVLAAIAWHWFYYVYCGAAFLWGAAVYYGRRELASLRGRVA